MKPLTINDGQVEAALTWFYGTLLEDVDKTVRQQLERQLLMMLLTLPAMGEA